MATSQATQAPLVGHVVGENLRRIRERRGLTQVEAAGRLRAAGLRWQRSHVAAIEASARETVDVAVLTLIASAFGVPVTELFAGEGPVRLTPEATMSRDQLREIFPPGRVGIPEVSGGAARRAIAQMPGETVSFHADAELANKLGLRPEDVYQTAERLWGRTLHQERDRRIAEMGELTAGQRRAKRGHITRQLAKEIEPHLPGKRS